MDLIGEVFPHLIPDDEGSNRRFDIIYTLLSDLTEKQFEKAVVVFLTSHKEIFPNTNWIAHIRDYGLADERKTGLEAWGEVEKAIREMSRTRYLPYPKTEGMDRVQEYDAWRKYQAEQRAEPEFRVADPIAERVARGMGIRYLRFSESPEIDRAHFIKAYEQIRDAEARKRLAGFAKAT